MSRSRGFVSGRIAGATQPYGLLRCRGWICFPVVGPSGEKCKDTVGGLDSAPRCPRRSSCVAMKGSRACRCAHVTMALPNLGCSGSVTTTRSRSEHRTEGRRSGP